MKLLLCALLLAPAALAFAPDHIVVVDDAVVYDEDHNYEDDYVIARLPYWTPVVAESVGTPMSARTYCLVTTEDGRRGLTEWDTLGWALKAVRDDVPIYSQPPTDDTAGTVVGRLAKGELVAYAVISSPVFIDYHGVMTASRLKGFVHTDDLEPVAPPKDD
ncbi:MAG: hypothetical protein PVH29_12670 [Candidatus Zixiibacteriota bacterium]|jgi:phosphatidylserine/phosphatidylglycerophosphate/cardiolipin synthase-like enzyme